MSRPGAGKSVSNPLGHALETILSGKEEEGGGSGKGRFGEDEPRDGPLRIAASDFGAAISSLQITREELRTRASETAKVEEHPLRKKEIFDGAEEVVSRISEAIEQLAKAKSLAQKESGQVHAETVILLTNARADRDGHGATEIDRVEQPGRGHPAEEPTGKANESPRETLRGRALRAVRVTTASAEWQVRRYLLSGVPTGEDLPEKSLPDQNPAEGGGSKTESPAEEEGPASEKIFVGLLEGSGALKKAMDEEHFANVRSLKETRELAPEGWRSGRQSATQG